MWMFWLGMFVLDLHIVHLSQHDTPVLVEPFGVSVYLVSSCLTCLCFVGRAAAVIATDKEDIVDRVKEITGRLLLWCNTPFTL